MGHYRGPRIRPPADDDGWLSQEYDLQLQAAYEHVHALKLEAAGDLVMLEGIDALERILEDMAFLIRATCASSRAHYPGIQ